MYKFNEIIFAQVNEQVKYWLFVESWQSGKSFSFCCVRVCALYAVAEEEVFVSGCVFIFLENEIEILRRFYVLNETKRNQ